MHQSVMMLKQEELFSVKGSAVMPNSIAVNAQVFSDKATTRTKSKPLVAYRVHVVLLNFSVAFRQYFFVNSQSVFGCLPVREASGGAREWPRRLQEETLRYQLLGMDYFKINREKQMMSSGEAIERKM